MANGPVLVVDFGAQYAQLIARRVREAGVYSELVPHSMPVDEILAKDPKAIILSGGPASVFEPGAPTIDTKVFESGVPVLGICYGFQVMAYELGGKVDKAALGEYGKTSATIDDAAGILADSPAEQTTWMSHGVAVEQAPALRSAGPHRRRARGRHGGRIPQALWCAVAPGSQALPAWPEAYRKLPAPLRRAAQRLGCLLDYRGSSQEDPRAGRRRRGDLRPVRRR